MASIKTQKLVYSDEERGLCSSGTASIIGTKYSREAKSGHCEHWVIEALGKVIQYDAENHNGVFLSRTRGLISYDLATDRFDEVDINDPRLAGTDIEPYLITQTDFGDVYFALCAIARSGLFGVLREAFSVNRDFERVLCHTIHSVVSNSERIQCGDFVQHSCLSYICKETFIKTLNHDSAYFWKMGEHEVKVLFFRNYIAFMRKKFPGFGRACYVDSTPLPNDVKNNPFNYFSDHGTGGQANQTRLVLIVDIETGKPIWFTFICGNILDLQTIEKVQKELKINLELTVEGLTLDAGYAYKDLFEAYNIDNVDVLDDAGNVIRQKDLIIRMPDKNGYPLGDLYQSVKKILYDMQYGFTRGKHTYFGMRFERYDICGCHEYCYVYLDRERALELTRKYMREQPEEWAGLTPEQKNWKAIENAFFVLVSCRCRTPEETLDLYFGRMDIEALFKTLKEYIHILPIKKWTKQAVKGKVMNDMIALLFEQECRAAIAPLAEDLPKWFSTLTAIETTLTKEELLTIDTPPRQIREAYESLDIPLAGHISIDDLRKIVAEDVIPQSPSIEKSKGRKPGNEGKTKSVRVPLSKEQKEEQRRLKAEEKKRIREEARQRKKAERQAQREEAQRKLKEAKAAERAKKKAERQARREEAQRKLKEAKAAERARKKAEKQLAEAIEKAQRRPVYTGKRGRPRLEKPKAL